MSQPRKVLVTGTSRGLGRAIAEHLLTRGDQILGCSRGEGSITHANYFHVEADVRDEGNVSQLLGVARERLGGLDVLINNAGVGRMLPLALTPLGTVQNILSTNFLGVFLLMHGATRLLRKSTAGRIINFTTVAVPLRLEGEAIYAASKAAVEMLTRVAAKELGPMGITCNAIGPSPIRTDLIRNVPEEKLQSLIKQQSIHRWAEASDVTNLVDFFLQPESSMVTGQVIYLGGLG